MARPFYQLPELACSKDEGLINISKGRKKTVLTFTETVTDQPAARIYALSKPAAASGPEDLLALVKSLDGGLPLLMFEAQHPREASRVRLAGDRERGAASPPAATVTAPPPLPAVSSDVKNVLILKRKNLFH